MKISRGRHADCTPEVDKKNNAFSYNMLLAEILCLATAFIYLRRLYDVPKTTRILSEPL